MCFSVIAVLQLLHVPFSYLSFSVRLGQPHLSEHLGPLFHHQGSFIRVRADVAVMLEEEETTEMGTQWTVAGSELQELKRLEKHVPSRQPPPQLRCEGGRGRLPGPSSSGWNYPPSGPP